MVDVFGGDGQAFFRVRQRQQVVQIDAFDTAPCQMLRHQEWFERIAQRSNPGQMVAIKWGRCPQRKSHAVKGERILGGYPLQGPPHRTAAKIILNMNLEPQNSRSVAHHLGKVRYPQPDARRCLQPHGSI
jgi:hypothetical protein